LMDFGVAKAIEADQAGTRTGDVLGTLRYMSPEQIRGKPERRSDVYSLGLTLYEVMAGTAAVSDADLRQAMVEGRPVKPPPPLRSLVPDVPRDLETILHRAMAQEPARRYAGAAELAKDLQHFLDGEPIDARRVSSLERVAFWARRNPALAGLTSLSAALLVTVAVTTSTMYLRIQSAYQQSIVQRARNERTSRIASDSMDRIFDTFAAASIPGESLSEMSPRAPFFQSPLPLGGSPVAARVLPAPPGADAHDPETRAMNTPPGDAATTGAGAAANRPFGMAGGVGGIASGSDETLYSIDLGGGETRRSPAPGPFVVDQNLRRRIDASSVDDSSIDETQQGRLALLSQLLVYYQDLANNAAEDSRTRLSFGRALHRTGAIYFGMGRFHEAERNFRDAYSVYTVSGHFADLPPQQNYLIAFRIANLNVARARCAMAFGQHENARVLLDQALLQLGVLPNGWYAIDVAKYESARVHRMIAEIDLAIHDSGSLPPANVAIAADPQIGEYLRKNQAVGSPAQQIDVRVADQPKRTAILHLSKAYQLLREATVQGPPNQSRYLEMSRILQRADRIRHGSITTTDPRCAAVLALFHSPSTASTPREIDLPPTLPIDNALDYSLQLLDHAQQLDASNIQVRRHWANLLSVIQVGESNGSRQNAGRPELSDQSELYEAIALNNQRFEDSENGADEILSRIESQFLYRMLKGALEVASTESLSSDRISLDSELPVPWRTLAYRMLRNQHRLVQRY
ncbi:MAG: protein kinase, partial [Planctomycetota bacterium]